MDAKLFEEMQKLLALDPACETTEDQEDRLAELLKIHDES